MPRPADRLTLSSQPAAPPAGAPAGPRPWIGMHWRCCDVYARIYRHPEADRYRGSCPRCGRSTTLRVGSGGTSARSFTFG